MQKQDNPPAFPLVCDNPMRVQYQGMTLRDYFASKVMNGICCNQFYLSALLEDFKGINDKEMKAKIANVSYEMADAMIQERNK
jgi:hypothetical protein